MSVQSKRDQEYPKRTHLSPQRTRQKTVLLSVPKGKIYGDLFRVLKSAVPKEMEKYRICSNSATVMRKVCLTINGIGQAHALDAAVKEAVPGIQMRESVPTTALVISGLEPDIKMKDVQTFISGFGVLATSSQVAMLPAIDKAGGLLPQVQWSKLDWSPVGNRLFIAIVQCLRCHRHGRCEIAGPQNRITKEPVVFTARGLDMELEAVPPSPRR